MADKEKVIEKVKETKDKFSVGSVATETMPVIVDDNGNAITQIEALAIILNKIDKIEKLLG